MRICACVVLYNPTNVFSNINSYPSFVEKVYIIDNSSVSHIDEIRQSINKKYEYYFLGENKGIAYALNLSCKLAMNSKFDFILTMDQDSVFPSDKYNDLILKYLNSKIIDEYGVLGLNFNSSSMEEKIVDTNFWITSGGFVNLKNYSKILGFKSELFIDYVDFELGEQFQKIGKKIGYINNISLQHTIGNPIKKKFFLKEITCLNHSPIRYYYRYRNSLYLYKNNKRFYRKKYFHDLIIDTLKILLFEPNKLEKIKMIKLGRKDAKIGKLGKFEPR